MTDRLIGSAVGGEGGDERTDPVVAESEREASIQHASADVAPELFE